MQKTMILQGVLYFLWRGDGMNTKWGLRLCTIIFCLSTQYQLVLGEPGDDNHTQGNSGQDRAAIIQGYIRLATSIAYKGYQFFSRDKVDYDLQADVLDVPYKKMVYMSVQAIEHLFDDANKHDNPPAQIQALILLCRMPVPEWYLKSFHKGLEVLYTKCFDEQGNFKDASGLGDIRVVFKDYCSKTPASWQQVAKITDRWLKNKKPHPMYTRHYADTCTEHNDELLNMIQADEFQGLVYLQYLLLKNGSPAAQKIYDYRFSQFLKYTINEVENKK